MLFTICFGCAVVVGCSSLQHKWMAMVVFERISRDRQLLLELYVNYDCDEFMTNIVERIINSMAKYEAGCVVCYVWVCVCVCVCVCVVGVWLVRGG